MRFASLVVGFSNQALKDALSNEVVARQLRESICLIDVLARTASAGLIGEWVGEVAGIGAARIIITGIKPSGQVEARMEFELQSYVSTFADKDDSVPIPTNLEIASGQSLTIESVAWRCVQSRAAGTLPERNLYARPPMRRLLSPASDVTASSRCNNRHELRGALARQLLLQTHCMLKNAKVIF